MKSGIKKGQIGIRGMVNTFLASNVATLLRLSGSRHYREFVRATKDIRGTQSAVLREMMKYASDTVFGREKGFARINNFDDYRKAVPVADYEFYRSFIDRHAAGEENVLFPGKPLMYNRTSGTTALPKLIPVTPYAFDRTVKNRSKLWFYNLLRHYPRAFDGKDLSLVSPAVEGHTKDGTAYGSLSGWIYQNIPEFMKLVHTTPYEVVTIDDYEAKIYTLVRFAFPSNVSCILTGNPASVVNLLSAIDRWKEDLIRDIHDGTLKASLNLPPTIRKQCEARLEPAPERATELDRIASQQDTLRTEHYWKNLSLVHCWTNGNCRLVVPRLRPMLGKDTPILDFGYLASEVTAADVIDPATQGSVLQIKNVLFEFSPFEEGDTPQTFLLPHEVEIGERYYVYVSTFNGLYRYDMNDIVEVADFFNETPIIRFLFKGKGVTSLQGEKLSESQFIKALKKASEKMDIRHEFFVAIADGHESRYNLYIEFCGKYSNEQLGAFAKEIDESLCKVNLEYEAKLHSHRLKPLKVIQLGTRAFEMYRSMRLKEGALEGQLKWLNLCCTDAEKDRMQKLVTMSREAEPGACFESS